jgi:hypothetical protein
LNVGPACFPDGFEMAISHLAPRFCDKIGGASTNSIEAGVETGVDLYKALRVLYEQRNKLDEVIASLEELQRKAASEGEEKRLEVREPGRRGRRSMDEESRRQVSERMKAYWAERKRKSAGSAEPAD